MNILTRFFASSTENKLAQARRDLETVQAEIDTLGNPLDFPIACQKARKYAQLKQQMDNLLSTIRLLQERLGPDSMQPVLA